MDFTTVISSLLYTYFYRDASPCRVGGGGLSQSRPGGVASRYVPLDVQCGIETEKVLNVNIILLIL